MVFGINGKVALITGGASGMGFQFAHALLKNGSKGIVIVDVNTELGEGAAKKLNDVHGNKKVIFLKADVTDINQLEAAFKQTIKTFTHIDILINNAGVVQEPSWETSIKVNINGVFHGIYLGLETYLKQYKSTKEAIIVNTISTVCTEPVLALPVYTFTKFATMGMVKSWGCPEHFQRTGVRILGICPGATNTPLFKGLNKTQFLSSEYEKLFPDIAVVQEPEFVAQELIEIIQKAPNGSLWIIEDGAPSYEYILPLRQKFKLTYE